jgi:hypothetical protein
MTLSKTNVRDLPKFIKLAHDLDAQVGLRHLALDENGETNSDSKIPHSLFDDRKEVPIAYPKENLFLSPRHKNCQTMVMKERWPTSKIHAETEQPPNRLFRFSLTRRRNGSDFGNE